MKIIFDMDDQSDEHNALPWLLHMKQILPGLKVNLFTIPDKCSGELEEELLKHDWIRLIQHGFFHDTNYEFAKLDYKAAQSLFSERPGWSRGFKAPGWQISEAAMKAVKDRGWWLAVQYSDGRFNGDVNGPYQPKVLPEAKFYAINEVLPGFRAIHGHTWECCGNGPKDLEPILKILPIDSQFIFIDDYVENLPG